MKYSKVHSLKWASADQSEIDCFVRFEALKVDVPFTATATDTEAHGREIFERCLRGDFGAIAEYQPVSEMNRNVDFDAIHVQGWPHIQQFLEQANAENNTGSIRGIVLVWSSIIEDLLGDLLCSFAIEHGVSEDLKRAPASQIAKLCFALGLICHKEYTITKKIHEVRNSVAHSWSVSVESPEVSGKAMKALKALYDEDHAALYRWSETDLQFMIRHFYTLSCAMLAMKLPDRIVETRMQRRVQRQD